MTVKAKKFIAKGEPITITYCNILTNTENRLKKLLVTESDKVTFKLEEINYEEAVDFKE